MDIKRCIRCRKEKEIQNFCEFIASRREGKIKQRRNTCYDCNYRTHIYKAFTWQRATKKEIIKRLKERFEKYVVKKEGCWEWKGFVRPDGYTRMRVGFHEDSRSIGGHVVSWMIYHNKFKLCNFMKEKFYILHKCDNKTCTNPKHLFVGTSTDNMIDMLKKNRGPKAKLTIKQVKTIKQELKEGKKIGIIAQAYNVNPSTIGDIKHNRTWCHVIID